MDAIKTQVSWKENGFIKRILNPECISDWPEMGSCDGGDQSCDEREADESFIISSTSKNRKTLDDFWQELLMKFPQLHLRLPNHPNSTIRCGRIFYLVFDTPLEYDIWFPSTFETRIISRILKRKTGTWSWHLEMHLSLFSLILTHQLRTTFLLYIATLWWPLPLSDLRSLGLFISGLYYSLDFLNFDDAWHLQLKEAIIAMIHGRLIRRNWGWYVIS